MSTTAAQDAPSDAELISRVRTGDHDAYGALFERHREAARRMARQLVTGPDVDDLVSEAFTKVLVILQRGSGPDIAFRAYLLTAIRRLHIDRARTGQRVQVTDDLEALDRDIEFADPATASFERGAAASAFASLPERWRLVLWHLEVEGQKPADIAPILGMSPNSVAALAYRAREGLRQAYLQSHLADTAEETCRWTTEHLGAYVRKGLAKRDSAKVQSHLDECRRCTAVYLELTEVNSNLAGILGPALLGAAAPGYLAAGGGAKIGVLLLTPWTKLKDAGGAVQAGVAGAAVTAVVAVAALTQLGGDETDNSSEPSQSQPAPDSGNSAPQNNDSGPQNNSNNAPQNDSQSDSDSQPAPNNDEQPDSEPDRDEPDETPPDDEPDEQEPDQTVPDAPIEVDGDISGDQVTLSWKPATADDVRGYRVYRTATPVAAPASADPASIGGASSADAVSTVSVASTPAANGRGDLVSDGTIDETSFTDSTVVDGQRYRYVVTAVGTTGDESPVSQPFRVTYDLVPEAPTDIRTRERDAGIVIAWRANSEPDLDGYQLYRDGEAIGELSSRSRFVDRDTTDGETYSYAVQAVDVGGKASERSDAVDATYDPVPEAPARVRATATDDGIRVNWSAVRGPDTRAYRLYRDGDAIERTDATSYIDEDVADGETYRYTVRTLDRGGQRSASSDSARATYDIAPAEPERLRAKASADAITLRWSRNAESDVDHYDIYRDDERIATSSAPRYTDTDVTDGESYTYHVRAVDGGDNESPLSDSATASYDPHPDTPTGLEAQERTGDVELSWDESSEPDFARYRVYRDGELIDETTRPRYTDRGVVGSEATYEVTTVDAAGQESDRSDPATVELAPAPPRGLVAVEGHASVELSWQRSPEADVVGYIVLRNGVPLSGTVSGSGFVDRTAVPGVSYEYEVIAVDSTGQRSGQSRSASGVWAAPATPTGLDWEMRGSSLWLLWAPNDNRDVDHYQVDLDGRNVATTTATEVHDGSHHGTVTHTLRVTAVDAAGNASPTACLTFTHEDTGQDHGSPLQQRNSHEESDNGDHDPPADPKPRGDQHSAPPLRKMVVG